MMAQETLAPNLTADLFAGLAFAFDFPGESHVRVDPCNQLLVALVRASDRDSEMAAWLDRLTAVLPEQEEVSSRLPGLRREFQRLFELPSPVVLPYESAWVTPNDSPGVFSSGIAASYREAGLCQSPDFRDLSDHVCLELELLAHLSRRTECNPGGKNEADRFRTEHLDRWLPGFLGAVESRSEDDYYRLAAGLGQALLFAAKGRDR